MMQNVLRLILANDNEVPSAKPEVEVVPTTAAHVRELSRTMREMDRREAETIGWSAEKTLWRSYKCSVQVQTLMIGGQVAAVGGVGGEFMGGVGAPWLLTNDRVRLISPLRFTKLYQTQVFQMLELFPVLVNYVLADYESAIRVLQIVGFTLGEPESVGKEMFRRFEMRAR